MRRLQRLLPVCAAVLALHASAPASAEETMGPCSADNNGWVVCGGGSAALRVIRDTISPSGRYGVAWRALGPPPAVVGVREEDGMHRLDSGKAENLLVRIADGAILARLGGSHHGDDSTLNHAEARAFWSPDSRLLVEFGGGKWELATLGLYAVGDDGTVVGPVRLLQLAQGAAAAELAKELRVSLDGYVMNIYPSPENPLAIDREGDLALPVTMQIPKSDIDCHVLVVTLRLSGTDGGPTANVASVSSPKRCE